MTRWKESDLKRKSSAKPSTPTLTPETVPEPVRPEESAQIEALPASSADVIRWQQAAGLHQEQFGTRFRLVIVGPLQRASEVTDLLHSLPFTKEV